MKYFMLILASVAVSLSVAQAANTGKLVGHVDVGPISPVEHVGHKEKMPPQVYKNYTISISQPGPHNGQMKSHLLRMIKQLKLSGDGDFSTDLAPGEYRVEVVSQNSMMRSQPKTVTITAGKTTKITLHVDTGIR